MADKILLIKVDPCCPCCFKKIKKILCKLQACENIKTITYDEKNYTVTLSGPFDPQNLSRKILCKACKLIIEIKVVDPPKPSPPPPPPPKPQTINRVCNDIEIIVKDKDPKCTVTKKVIKECIPEKEKKDGKDEKKTETINKVCNDIKIIVKDKCPAPPPPPPPPSSPPKHCQKPPCPTPCPPPCPPPCEPPFKPPVCQVCCWTGCSVGYQGGSSCYSCGRIYGCVPDGPPMGRGGPSHGGYRLVCEQDPPPSCTMM